MDNRVPNAAKQRGLRSWTPCQGYDPVRGYWSRVWMPYFSVPDYYPYVRWIWRRRYYQLRNIF